MGGFALFLDPAQIGLAVDPGVVASVEVEPLGDPPHRGGGQREVDEGVRRGQIEDLAEPPFQAETRDFAGERSLRQRAAVQ